MTYDPSFTIYVNYVGEKENLNKQVRDAVPEAEWQTAWAGFTPHNHVRIEINEFYNVKPHKEEPEYLFYKYEVNVISRIPHPIDETEMKLQAKLAQKILTSLKESGFEVVLDNFDVNKFL